MLAALQESSRQLGSLQLSMCGKVLAISWQPGREQPDDAPQQSFACWKMAGRLLRQSAPLPLLPASFSFWFCRKDIALSERDL